MSQIHMLHRGGRRYGIGDYSTLQSTIIQNGLILYYDVSSIASYTSGSSVISDLSLNSNNGTLHGPITYTTSNNGALVFNGSNTYITTQLNISLFPNTLCGWVYPLNTNAGGGSTIISNDVGGWGVGLGFNSNQWEVHTGNSQTLVGSTSNNKWYYACITYTSVAWTLFVNGVPSYTGASATYGASVAWIGSDPYSGGSRWFQGNIAAIQCYNRVLTNTEIAYNFGVNRTRFGV